MVKTHFIGLFFILLCWSLPQHAFATDSAPPEIPGPGDGTANPTYHRALVNRLHVGDLVIELQSTKLSDLINRFPGLSRDGRGDAGDAESWVCFTMSTQRGNIRVWPNSGEMGGDNYVIGLVIAYAPEPSEKKCPSIFKSNVSADLGLDVWLGTPKAMIEQKIGTPSKTYGSIISYDFDFPLAGPNPQDCSVYGGIDFAIKHGRVDKIWLNKATSC